MVSAQAAALPRAGSNRDAGAPDLEQHLLGDLLGLGRISQHLPDHPVHRPGQLAVDQLERPVVAARHQGQQGGQVRLMFRHRVRLPLSYIRPAHALLFEARRIRIAPASLRKK